MNEAQLSTLLTTEQLDGFRYLLQIENDRIDLTNRQREIQRLQNPNGNTPANSPLYTLETFVDKLVVDKGNEGARLAFSTKLQQAAANYPGLAPEVQQQILTLANVPDVLRS